jgi:hypothetical protein
MAEAVERDAASLGEEEVPEDNDEVGMAAGGWLGFCKMQLVCGASCCVGGVKPWP